MFFVIGALRAVVDRTAARHAVQARVLAMLDAEHAVAVLASESVVFDDLAELALNRRKRLSVVYYYVPDLTIGLSPR